MRRIFIVVNIFWWSLMTGKGSDLESSEFYISNTSSGDMCWLYEMHEVSNEMSMLKCAALCSVQECKGYYFKDGSCTLAGFLVAPSTGMTSMAFEKIKSFTLVNFALGKPTGSVPDHRGYVASYAVDGDDELAFHSAVGVTQPWWFVDLGENRIVKEIHVLPVGAGNLYAQFTTIEIRVGKDPVGDGDFSGWDLFLYYPGPAPYSQEFLKFSSPTSGLCGRYVSIKKMGTAPNEYFCLNEVKVFVYGRSME